MSFPQIASVIKGDATGSPSAAYHTSGESTYSNGDLLILIASNDGGGDTASVAGEDSWAVLESQNGSNHGRLYSYQILTGSSLNGGTFTITQTDTGEGIQWLLIHITGYHGTTAPEIGVAVSESGLDWPEVSLLVSGWDASAEDTLVIASITSDNSGDTISLFPFAANQHTTDGQTSASYGYVAMCSDEQTSATVSYSETANARSGTTGARAQIIAIRPAAGGGGGAGLVQNRLNTVQYKHILGR